MGWRDTAELPYMEGKKTEKCSSWSPFWISFPLPKLGHLYVKVTCEDVENDMPKKEDVAMGFPRV